tara:strand:+ start:108 stop:350 length:243 start_codon:yes stop_codon:yes gene_type:complete
MLELSQEVIEEIKELTFNNDHTKARLLISKELMLVDLYREYNEIDLAQQLSNELPEEFYERRNAADKFLFSIASQYKNLF